MSYTQTENYRYEHDMMTHHHGYNSKYGMNSPQVSSSNNALRIVRSPYDSNHYHGSSSLKTPQNNHHTISDKRFIAPAVVTASTPTMKTIKSNTANNHDGSIHHRPSRSNSLELKERNNKIARKIFASPEDHHHHHHHQQQQHHGGMYEPPSRREDGNMISPRVQGPPKQEYFSPREDFKLMQQRRFFFAPPSSTRTLQKRSHPPSRIRHRTVFVSHISPQRDRNESSYRDDFIDGGLHLHSNSYNERDHPNEKEMEITHTMENQKRRVQSTDQMIHINSNRPINHIHVPRHRHSNNGNLHHPYHLTPSQKRMESRPQEMTDIHMPLLKHEYNTETRNSPNNPNHSQLDASNHTNSPIAISQEQKKLFSPDKTPINKKTEEKSRITENETSNNFNTKPVSSSSELESNSTTAPTKLHTTANESNPQVHFKHDGHLESENARHISNTGNQYQDSNSTASFMNGRSHSKVHLSHGPTSTEREDQEYFHNSRYHQTESFDSVMAHPSDYHPHPRYAIKRSNRHSPYPHPNNGSNEDYHASLYLTLSPSHALNAQHKDKHFMHPPPYKNMNTYRNPGYLRDHGPHPELSPMDIIDEKENVKRMVPSYNPYKYEYHPPLRSNRIHSNHHRPRNLDLPSSHSYHEPPANDIDQNYMYHDRHHRYRHEISRDHMDDYRNRYHYEDERYYPPMHRYYEEAYDHCDNYPQGHQTLHPNYRTSSRMEVTSHAPKEIQSQEMKQTIKKRKNVTPPATVSQRKRKKMYSDYVGVTYNKTHAKFQACITHYRKQHYLGRYKLAVDAAKAYDDSAKMLKGNGWKINFKTNEEYEIAKKEEEERNRKAIQVKKEEQQEIKKDTGDNENASMNVNENIIKNESQEKTESSLDDSGPKISSLTSEQSDQAKSNSVEMTSPTKEEKQDSKKFTQNIVESIPSNDVIHESDTVVNGETISNSNIEVPQKETNEEQKEKPSDEGEIGKNETNDSNISNENISNMENSPKCANETIDTKNDILSEPSVSKEAKENDENSQKAKVEVSTNNTDKNDEADNSSDQNEDYMTQQPAPVLQNGTLEAASALMTLIQRDRDNTVQSLKKSER